MAILSETSSLLPLSHRPLSSSRRHYYRRESYKTGFRVVAGEDIKIQMTMQTFQVSETKFEWATAFQSSCQWLGRHCAVPFTLLMSAIGAGTLAVPYTFVLLSPVQAMVVLCCVGLAMGFTADTLVHVYASVATENAGASQVNRETYQHLAWRTGGKALARVTGTLTAFAVFGACVGCVCVVKDMAPIMLPTIIAGFEQQPLEMQQHAVVIAVWVVGLVVALPLGCLTKISALRFSSYLGVAFSVYLVGAVAYRAFFVACDEAESDALLPSVPKTEAPLFWRVSEVAGIYNFTFMLHLNVIPLLAQLMAAGKTRIQIACGNDIEALGSAKDTSPAAHVLQRARQTLQRYLALVICTCVLLYALFGVCAAQIYGNRTQGNILLNLTNDQIMAVPRLAVLLTLLFSFPLLFHPLRSLVLELIMACTSHNADKHNLEKREKQDQELSPVAKAVVTALLIIAQILCALRVPGIHVVFSFVGSSILLILCYLFPLIFYVRLVPWRSSRKGSIRLLFLSVIAVVASVLCATATLQLVLSS